MRADRGFTLLEVLVSVTLAVTLLGLGFVAFRQVQKAAQRNGIMTDLAVEAGYLYQRISNDLAGCHPGSQFGVRRIPVPASLYASGHASELWFLKEMSSHHPGNTMDRLNTSESDYPSRAVWVGWQWRPARPEFNEKLGSLWMTRSTSSRRERKIDFPSHADVPVYQGVQPRTSRKRPLTDNDGSLLINAAAAPLVRYVSDEIDLWGEDRNLNGILDPGEDKNADGGLTRSNLGLVSARVKNMTWQWVDYAGGTVTASADQGVVTKGSTGAVIAPTGDPWWTSDVRVVDGLYRDGRTTDGDVNRSEKSVLSWRPSQLRLELVLADAASGIERTFSFTHSLHPAIQYNDDCGVFLASYPGCALPRRCSTGIP